ncbi:MAG TPA: D-sedoheptulose 7-phosphate isomerase [Ferruginibacter sp.]|nr:D-sedoheptulose 7-phosphate isomerase [Ferruginibacter sp.]HRO05523.1 D-sedoheptulose 7-phosphate isomerase [Ferruginibacter sp.]HRO96273.1 D-sedoheptulose 7-phosphate isomerase [Ferruginibacter sp.]HRP49433.1 D-sedoheptulose 7-phosphate isomerase [Ferruginibacter sp.]
MMKKHFQQRIAESILLKEQIMQSDHYLQVLEDCVQVITQCFSGGHTLWLCGNGGSAADAQHLAAEFSGRFYKDRKALPAEALHVNTSYITAVANDYGYSEIYARLIDGVAQPGDVLIGLSTSGNSENIVKAFQTAQQKGVITIGFTGASGGKMLPYSDYIFQVPSQDTPRIQEMHMLAGHTLCELVESNLFGS